MALAFWAWTSVLQPAPTTTLPVTDLAFEQLDVTPAGATASGPTRTGRPTYNPPDRFADGAPLGAAPLVNGTDPVGGGIAAATGQVTAPVVRLPDDRIDTSGGSVTAPNAPALTLPSNAAPSDVAAPPLGTVALALPDGPDGERREQLYGLVWVSPPTGGAATPTLVPVGAPRPASQTPATGATELPAPTAGPVVATPTRDTSDTSDNGESDTNDNSDTSDTSDTGRGKAESHGDGSGPTSRPPGGPSGSDRTADSSSSRPSRNGSTMTETDAPTDTSDTPDTSDTADTSENPESSDTPDTPGTSDRPEPGATTSPATDSGTAGTPTQPTPTENPAAADAPAPTAPEGTAPAQPPAAPPAPSGSPLGRHEPSVLIDALRRLINAGRRQGGHEQVGQSQSEAWPLVDILTLSLPTRGEPIAQDTPPAQAQPPAQTQPPVVQPATQTQPAAQTQPPPQYDPSPEQSGP